jgi:hypothetical protein
MEYSKFEYQGKKILIDRKNAIVIIYQKYMQPTIIFDVKNGGREPRKPPFPPERMMRRTNRRSVSFSKINPMHCTHHGWTTKSYQYTSSTSVHPSSLFPFDRGSSNGNRSVIDGARRDNSILIIIRKIKSLD